MTIDISALEAYREIMGEEADAFIADIIKTYIQNGANLVQIITDSLASGDKTSFERAAHTLKSTSATVGAKELSAVAAELESLCKTEALSTLAPKVGQLAQEFSKAEAELQAHREELG
ncbi:MAG: Hpt domain-containing protein [Chloroflexi bacterium]|nr:Hpt domain-containing protein [Chloroflexota bacterium]